MPNVWKKNLLVDLRNISDYVDAYDYGDEEDNSESDV